MQRYRRNDIGFCQQGAGGALHPDGEGDGGLSVVRMLEAEDHSLAAGVIGQRCPGSCPQGWFAQAASAETFSGQFVVEGKTAAVALGRTEKAEARPAGRAEAVNLDDDAAATQTTWRQQQIQRSSSGLGEQGGKGGRLHPRSHGTFPVARSGP